MNTNSEEDCEITMTRSKFIAVLTDLSNSIASNLSTDKDEASFVEMNSIIMKKLNDLIIDNRCKGTYKSGPKKGLRCKTIVSPETQYCKKHIQNNKMGIWAKTNSKNSNT